MVRGGFLPGYLGGNGEDCLLVDWHLKPARTWSLRKFSSMLGGNQCNRRKFFPPGFVKSTYNLCMECGCHSVFGSSLPFFLPGIGTTGQ